MSLMDDKCENIYFHVCCIDYVPYSMHYCLKFIRPFFCCADIKILFLLVSIFELI